MEPAKILFVDSFSNSKKDIQLFYKLYHPPSNTYILYFWQEKQPLSFLSEKEKSFFDGKKCRFSEGSPDSLS